MYAITETEQTREIDFEFADGSFFSGTVNLGVYWDGDWKLNWVEGLLIDPNENEHEFTSETGMAHNIMRLLNDEVAFRRRATDWAEEALQEHKEDLFYDYDEQH